MFEAVLAGPGQGDVDDINNSYDINISRFARLFRALVRQSMDTCGSASLDGCGLAPSSDASGK